MISYSTRRTNGFISYRQSHYLSSLSWNFSQTYFSSDTLSLSFCNSHNLFSLHCFSFSTTYFLSLYSSFLLSSVSISFILLSPFSLFLLLSLFLSLSQQNNLFTLFSGITALFRILIQFIVVQLGRLFRYRRQRPCAMAYLTTRDRLLEALHRVLFG